MFRRFSALRNAPSAASVALGISDATQKRLAELIESSKKKAATTHSASALSAAPGRGFAFEVVHVRGCNAEITQLLKMPEVKNIIGMIDTSAPALSSAELIHRTAFSPSATIHGRNDDHVHDAGCPIKAGEYYMQSIAAPGKDKPSACKHCLRRRLNYLASEHFAHNLHWNSIMPNANAANHINNQKVYQLVRESFGTMRALEDTLAEFAVNRRDSGFTWLVYNPQANAGTPANPATPTTAEGQTSNTSGKGRLEVVNLPGSTSPVVLGLWPILCINLTTETIVDTMTYAEAAHAEQCSSNPLNVAHSWSRAARNPASAVTRQNTTPDVEMTLTDLRRLAATQQCRSLDIAFMEAQTQAALNYFSSADYLKATEERRRQLAAEAQAKVAKAFDNVEIEAVNELKKVTIDANNKAKAAAVSTADANKNQKSETTNKAPTTSKKEEGAAAVSSSPTAAAAESALAEEKPAAAPAAEEPDGESIVAEGLCDDGQTRYVTRYNGITSYSHPNGTTTDIFPDGRRVAYANDLTTTTFPDGTVHYLYANGATVEIRPDGTKYVNGEFSKD